MPFTFPISESIDLNMVQTITGITVANSFQVTLSPVVRYASGDPPAPADMLAVVESDDDRPAHDADTPRDETAIGHVQWYRPYFVTVYLAKLPNNTTPYPAWRNLVRAEVEKAVLRDRGRGGIAGVVDTYARGMRSFNDANDGRGIIVVFEVGYRTDDDDPYLPG